MWYKHLTILILFYLLAILQNSFFVHFNLFGAKPNLVFILFFLLAFFSTQSGPILNWETTFYAISAGLLLDFFSYTYFGVSIILFLLIGFVVKKVQTLLRNNRNNNFPFFYFLPLFLVSLIAYDLLLKTFSVSGLAYNVAVASVVFYVCKKFFKLGFCDRQLNLFQK
jgi:rod shape-determining protein MreD